MVSSVQKALTLQSGTFESQLLDEGFQTGACSIGCEATCEALCKDACLVG